MPTIPLAGGFYEDSSLQFNAERSVNMYPVVTQIDGGKGMTRLRRVPGLTQFGLVVVPNNNEGYSTLHTTADGRLFAFRRDVFGATHSIVINEFLENGTFIPRPQATSSAPFGDIVVSDNGLVMCIVTGTDKAYFFDLTANTTTEITDPDFPLEVFDVAFKDTYFIWLDGATDRFYISSNNATDPTNCIDALDFGTVESNPDRIVGIEAIGNEIAIFGTRTIEYFYNSGNADFPFERINGNIQEVGTLSRASISKINNDVFFLGSNDAGYGIVYVLKGYQLQRISTNPIERKIRESSNFENIIAYTYQDEGNYFYIITIPDINTTFGYDTQSGLWHERACLEEDGSYGQHPGTAQAFAFGKNIVSTIKSGGVAKLTFYDNDGYTNDTEVIKLQRTLAHIYNENKEVIVHELEFDVQKGTGVATGTEAETNPKIEIEMSIDGGITYGTTRIIELGKIGEYSKRVQSRRFGRGRDIVFRLTSTSPVAQEWFNMALTAEALLE